MLGAVMGGSNLLELLLAITPLCLLVLILAFAIVILKDLFVNRRWRRDHQLFLSRLRDPDPNVGGMSLPESLLEFYRSSPLAAETLLETVGLENSRLSILSFLPIDDQHVRRLKSGEISIAFAQTINGSEYLLRWLNGEISVWLRICENEMYLVSDSLETFLGSLRPDEIDD